MMTRGVNCKVVKGQGKHALLLAEDIRALHSKGCETKLTKTLSSLRQGGLMEFLPITHPMPALTSGKACTVTH